MVRTQLETRGIHDPRVLAAMGRVPRHVFVPAALRADAYQDRPLPIGHGQTISQPYIVALMSQLLELKGGERVLDVGTGCGYQTAVLAELGAEVFSIEVVPALAAAARARLRELGYEHVTVVEGNGRLGWPEAVPYDGILVAAAPRDVPPALVEQLAPGGRLVIPVGGRDQTLRKIVRTSEGIQDRAVAPVAFVPLV